MARLSIIIPTWNEESLIAGTIKSLSLLPGDEILVADGMSEDGTAETAEEAGGKVVRIRKGRAAQLNGGAAVSTGDILLFLHADTRVPPLTIERMRMAMTVRPEICGGGFARRFEDRSLFLAATCRLAGLRGRFFGIFLGDQGIFVRREVFERLGGFDESMPVAEDLDFSLRLKRAGRTILLGPPVSGSARRFEKLGPWRQTWKDFRFGAAMVWNDMRGRSS